MPEIDVHTPDTQKMKDRRLYTPRKQATEETNELRATVNRKQDRSKHPFRKRNRLLSRKCKESE